MKMFRVYSILSILAVMCSIPPGIGQDTLEHYENLERSIKYLEYQSEEYGHSSGNLPENMPGSMQGESGHDQFGRRKPVRETYTEYEHVEDLDTSKYDQLSEDELYERRGSGGNENGEGGSGDGNGWDEYYERQERERQRELQEKHDKYAEEYDKQNPDEEIREERIPPEKEEEEKSSPGGNFMVLLAILAVAVLVGFLVYYFYSKKPVTGSKKIGKDLEERKPEDIPLSELERALQNALAKGDYREAVRIYFIYIIKGLSEKNWIKWEKEKTNMAYLREMSGRSEYDGFNKAVLVYEIVWYGKHDLNKSEYKNVEPVFRRLLNKLGIK